MKYAFITRYKKTWPVDLMCRLLGVNRNAYYRYDKRKRAEQPDPEHQDMLDAVKAISGVQRPQLRHTPNEACAESARLSGQSTKG